MKGLLLKDFYMLKSYIKSMVMFIAIYLILGIVWDNAYVFSGISGVLCVIMIMNVFHYDNYAKWDKYGASLPMTRADIVGEKYLLALILVMIGALITALMYAVSTVVLKNSPTEVFSITIGTTVAALFLVSVLLPCIYKFGIEKGRLVLMFSGVLIGLMIAFGAWILPENWTSPAAQMPILFVAAAADGILFYASYKISCRIYQKKEL